MYHCVVIDSSLPRLGLVFYTIGISGTYILEILLLEWLLACYFVSSALPAGGEGGGGVRCPFSKNVLGVHPKFRI